MSKRQSRANRRANKRRSQRVQRAQKKRRSLEKPSASQTQGTTVEKRRRLKRVSEQLTTRRARLVAWYSALPLFKKVLLGLIVIPVIIALILLQGVILPFIAGSMGIIIAISKSAFIFVKGGAFIVYISYKVFKGLLGVYLCVSRSLSGWQAHQMRRRQAELPPASDAEYPALRYDEPEAESAPLTVRSGIKKLSLAGPSELEHTIIFSYLRYFIIGQIFMYLSFWRDKASYLTLWRRESRERVKEIFKEIGQTIFTPHLLGPHLTNKRLLVPGDARLISLSTGDASSRATYLFEVSWRERSFQRTSPYFVSAQHQAQWKVEVPMKFSSLSSDDLGYRREVSVEAES